MRRILFGLAAGVLGLAGLAGTADAHGAYHPHGGFRVARAPHVRFERREWNARFHRYHYWDAYRRCWVFYDPVRLGYFPCP
jgi:hypothetical protein